jgi:arylsulfate sulfotransferase
MEHFSVFESKSKSRRASYLLASTFLAISLLPSAALAGTAQIVDVEQGSTPFLGFAGAFYSGGTIASVSFSIQPLSGSVTRPLGATYSASYLNSHGYFIPGANAVIIPIFGLYAGTNNTINITYTFTDGTTNTQTTTLKTPVYTEPCAAVANRTYFNVRPNTASLTYDYFLLKDYCSTNSPAIIDTDNNIRWVGTAGFGSQDTGYFNNAFYATNGTVIDRIDITNGNVTKLVDLASAVTAVSVTGTHHQIDPGKTGLIVDVNTTAETEATAVEFNPTTGAILDTWDFGAIISAAMSAGGDSSTTISNFIQAPSSSNADWFHNNSVAYNPADNTLVVSSRENFVMAIDYDAPTNGTQRKIHWILGDSTKAWYNTPAGSLKKYALALGNSSTLAPIGQHGVSIDHLGNLLLFDDGLGSITGSNVPAGITRNYSAARSYQLTPAPTSSTVPKTATGILTYTASSGQNLFSPICGSVYDVAGNYLVDFATTNQAAAAATPASAASTVAGNNAIIGNYLLATSNNQTSVILVGVGGTSNIEFVSAIASATPCTAGWNALPFSNNVFTF